MPELSNERVLQILKDGKKDLNIIRKELGVKKNEIHEIEDILNKLLKSKKIRKTVIDKKEYYKLLQEDKIKFRPLDIAYPLLIIIPIALILAYIISGFQQLPGPLYGGDTYWHLGGVLNIYDGNPPWSNPQVNGEYAYYGWITQFLVAVFAKISGLTPMSAYLYFAVIATILAGFISYLLGLEFFNDKKFALLLCFAWIGLTPFFSTSVGPMAWFLFMPLFILFFLKAIKTRRILYSISAGISLGLVSLSHTAGLPAALIILIVFFVYDSILRNSGFGFSPDEMRIKLSLGDREKIKSSIWKNMLFLLPIAVLGILISMLFFGPILFIYKGNTPNPVHKLEDYSKYGTDIAIRMLEGSFFNISALLGGNLYPFIFSFISLLGLYWVIKHKNNTNELFVLLLLISAIIGGFHYFITGPVFGRLPTYLYGSIMRTAGYVLFVFGIFGIYKWIPRRNPKNILLAIGFAFILINVGITINTTYQDTWIKDVAKSPQNPALIDMVNWVRENTDKNSVFLSDGELSFALNGLTGRKVMIFRRTHFSPYLDINKRIADAAVILYGNDSKKSLELLRKYNVSYIYWDANWMYFAYFDNTRIHEPLMTSLNYADYLSQYDVKFMRINWYLDPAWTPESRRFDVLAIYPTKWDIIQPWSDEFNQHLTLLKTFEIDNKIAYRIFEVDYSSFE